MHMRSYVWLIGHILHMWNGMKVYTIHATGAMYSYTCISSITFTNDNHLIIVLSLVSSGAIQAIMNQ